MLAIERLTFLSNGPYSLSVQPGESIGLFGKSGIGKSQLLRAIVDLLPHDGLVSLNGKSLELFSPPEWRKHVSLTPSESVWWHRLVGAHFPDNGIAQADRFEELGFDRDIVNWQVDRLSSGEKQRLALLRSLANIPSVLLLDEPTANLDENSTIKVEGLIKRYQKATSCMTIIVSHNIKQLSRMSDRIFLVEQHQLVEADREWTL